MTDISADPDHLRGIAARLAGLAARADVLTMTLADGGVLPQRSQFPDLPIGQRAAEVWSDGNSTFVDGLSVVQRGLSQISDSISMAAAGYEHADTRGAERILRTRPGDEHA